MPPPSLADVQSAMWRAWGRRTAKFLQLPTYASGAESTTVDDVAFEDLLLAASNLPPSSLFRRDFATMTAKDWTQLCLIGVNAAIRAEDLAALSPVARKEAAGDGPEVPICAGFWTPG